MRNRVVASLLIFILLLTSACGSSGAPAAADPGTKAVETPSAAADPNDSAPAPAAVPEAPVPEGKTPEQLLQERLQIFADFLPEYCVPLLNTDSPKPHFDLLLLDDDELPELAIIEDNYHPIGAHIFMVIDGKVKEVGEFGTFGAAWYTPKKSTLDNTDMAMGEMDRVVEAVDANGNVSTVKSFAMIEGEDGSIEKYLVDGKEVDADVFWQEQEAFNGYSDNAVIYDYALNYSDFKEDLYGALQDRYEHPFDFYSADLSGGSFVPSIEDLVGEWTLYRYETEGEDGYAGENGVEMHLGFYADKTVDFYQKTYDDLIDEKGLPLAVDDNGCLYFTYNSHDMDIHNTIVAINGGELELSISFENPDGSYGGSEWFFVR